MGALGALLIAAVAYSQHAGGRLADTYAPYIDAVLENELRVASAHLWFEEVMTGDPSVDIGEIWSTLDLAERTFKHMLQRDGEGGLPLSSPVVGEHFFREMEAAQGLLLRFREIAELRWEFRFGMETGIGTSMDQEFDAVFQEYRARLDTLLDTLRSGMDRELDAFNAMQRMLMGGIVLLGLMLGGVLHWFLRARALDRSAIREREIKLAITLDSIGDGVIVTDREGRVTRMNPVAESLTGWPLEDARSRKLEEVFRIVNARTRAPVPSPVDAVLSSGKKVGLANHTLLVARDGSESQVADSGAPIRGVDGVVDGVVLVFRDVTEEYAMREALRENEERQRDLLDNASAMITIKDPQGRFVFVNRQFEELLGVSREAILGKRAGDVHDPDDAKAIETTDRLVLKTGQPFRHEESFALADGGRTFLSVKFPLRRGAGDIYAICSIATDITPRKMAEEALRRSEERFQLAMKASRDGVWDWDIQRDEVYYSPGYAAMLGYGPDDFPGHVSSWTDLIHPEDRAFTVALNMECIENGSDDFETEFRMRAKNGDWRWILGRGRVVKRDRQGRAVRMVGTHTDITDRKRSEGELRNLRNYLSNIINSMPSMLIGVNGEGEITQWNERAAASTGIGPDQAVGRPLGMVVPWLEREMVRVREAMRTRSVQSEKRRSRMVRGESLHEDVSVFPLVSNGVEGAVIRVDDVTERVRLERMMVQSEKMLSVGGLAAGMAHEINNPLAGIMGVAQNISKRLLGDLPGNEETAREVGVSLDKVRAYLEGRGVPEMLQGIMESGRRAASIVSNMLRFSRKSDKRLGSHDLAELIDATLALAASDYDLETKFDFRKVDVRREFESGIPEVYCEGNEIQQVLLNLIKNGAQALTEKEFDGDEKPCLTIRLRREEDMAVVEIEDNGPGMEEHVRRRVFEPFFTTKEVGKGTGLGLSVSYFIVTDLHGGRMEVLSSKGDWTRFVIHLPLGTGPGNLPPDNG